jgi:hypothetical protein
MPAVQSLSPQSLTRSKSTDTQCERELFDPLKKLSRTVTSCPDSSRRSTRCDPTKPHPPVTLYSDVRCAVPMCTAHAQNPAFVQITKHPHGRERRRWLKEHGSKGLRERRPGRRRQRPVLLLILQAFAAAENGRLSGTQIEAVGRDEGCLEVETLEEFERHDRSS